MLHRQASCMRPVERDVPTYAGSSRRSHNAATPHAAHHVICVATCALIPGQHDCPRRMDLEFPEVACEGDVLQAGVRTYVAGAPCSLCVRPYRSVDLHSSHRICTPLRGTRTHTLAHLRSCKRLVTEEDGRSALRSSNTDQILEATLSLRAGSASDMP